MPTQVDGTHDSGHIVTHAVVPRDSRPDIKLLKDVLDGLRARL
ncbi:hypothetical protein ACFQ1S_25635 [Kibdelosporangium lantanae]|uniref:Uncharacterized protein n=1 Tax=Kibdelosporangium lantanae TaxID=1497396 RepID=A0ABW3MHM2_9PSEU